VSGQNSFFLLNFFENPSPEVRLYFVHSQVLYSHDAVKNVEGQRFTLFAVAESLKTTLMFKLEECFFPSAVRTMLQKLGTEGELPQEEVSIFMPLHSHSTKLF
jgi:hypothetical protein